MGFLIYILNIQNFYFLKKHILSYKTFGPEKGNMILSQNCRVVFFEKHKFLQKYSDTERMFPTCSIGALVLYKETHSISSFWGAFSPVFFQFGLKLILHAKVSGEEKCRNWCRKMGTNIAISGIHKNWKKKSEKKPFIDLFFVIWPLSGNYARFSVLS